MRSSLFLIIALVVFSACNTTERIVRFSPESTIGRQMDATSVNALKSQYGNVDGVYLNYEQTYEHNVSIAFTSTIPQWKFYEIVDRSYVVLNAASPTLSTFRLEVPENQTLEQAVLTVQAPGSSGFSYQKDDLTVQNGPGGSTIYTFSYPSVEPGTIIQEKYEMTREDLERNPPISHDVPLQYDLPAQQLSFQYVYPIWWQVAVKNLSLNQPLDFRRIEDPDRRKIVLAYTSENVPPYIESQAQAPFKQVAPYFQLLVTNLSMGSALRYRAPEDWTEFAREYRQYAVSPDTRLARSVLRTTENMIGTAASELDHVETLLNYVHDNISIVEDSKHRSFDQVLSRREGTSYMVTGLMQAMLYAANIDSEYLLVHPADEGYFDPDFLSADQLDVPALGVFVNNKQYYLFPGRQRSITEGLSPFYAGQTAMVITEEGFGGFTEVFSDQVQPSNMVASSGDATTQNNSAQNVSANNTNPPPPSNTYQPPPANTNPPVQQPGNQQPGNQQPGTNPQVMQNPPANNGGGLPPSPGITAPAIDNPQNPPPQGTPPVQVIPQDTIPSNNTTAPEWEGSIQTSIGGFTWVVASRTTIEEARELASQYINLYQAGISIDILSGESRGVVRYRIAIGQYTSRELAEEDRASRLRTVLPSDAWLLRIEPNM